MKRQHADMVREIENSFSESLHEQLGYVVIAMCYCSHQKWGTVHVSKLSGCWSIEKTLARLQHPAGRISYYTKVNVPMKGRLDCVPKRSLEQQFHRLDIVLGGGNMRRNFAVVRGNLPQMHGLLYQFPEQNQLLIKSASFENRTIIKDP